MSSGPKRIVFNTRERALSTDHNRALAFIAAANSNLLQAANNNRRSNYFLSQGLVSIPSAVSAPLQADCYGGLMVRPGTSDIAVQPGTLGCWAPDPGASTSDDSKYLLITDPGVTSPSALGFVSNSGGSQPRIDYVECQPVTTVTESDNRDVFNVVTGLFTPTLIPKVSAVGLQYRYRLGAAGAGVQVASGWLPLAVVVVSTAATDFTTCDFYDVRPLVEDRVEPQETDPLDPIGQGYYQLDRAEWAVRVTSGANVVGGFALATFKGYRAGGALRKSTASVGGTTFGGTTVTGGDLDAVNLDLVENQVAGFTHGVHQPASLVAHFPGGLPRWVRYSQSVVGALGRIPRGPNGILAVCRDFSNANANGVCLSNTLDVWGNVPGVILATIKSTAAGTGFGRATAQGRWTLVEEPKQSAVVPTVAGTTLNFDFAEGVDYPLAARTLRVTAAVFVNVIASDVSYLTFQLHDTSSAAVVAELHRESITSFAGTYTHWVTFDVPLKGRTLFNSGVSGDWRLSIVGANVAALVNTSRITVLGWEF